MKKLTKKLAALGMAVLMAAGTLMTAQADTVAGQWIFDGPEDWQWWYQETDGSYPASQWEMIGGKWYHFDADGYLDTGFREIDGQWYVLMASGALETNRDYGFASSDENGVFTYKTFEYGLETNPYADYCRQFGIDYDAILAGIQASSEYSITIPTANLPKDSEGGLLQRAAMECINMAIIYQANADAAPTNYNWEYSTSEDGSTMTVKFIGTFGIIMQH